MRLGAPLSGKWTNPDEWIQLVKDAGYTAAYTPVWPGVDDRDNDNAAAYAQAAQKAGIVIAEVGAWSNPIDPDSTKARAAITYCQKSLDLADRIGARCCVNIAGSRNPKKWDAPYGINFSRETFDMIVAITREIIDAVKPTRTVYALETMPCVFPSSPDEYLDLIKAIDRPGLGVHLDPVNMITSPSRYCSNADFIRECFAKLGPLIKSCHGKDTVLHDKLTVHIDECRPGAGHLDYGVFLRELSKLDRDTTLMLEHLPDEEYPAAAKYVRAVALEHKLELL